MDTKIGRTSKFRRRAKTPLIQAIHAVGGVSAMGRHVGLTRQAIQIWMKSTGHVPKAHVRKVERVSGIPRHVLRPDLFQPPEAQQPAPATLPP